jgi:hypothetical protein
MTKKEALIAVIRVNVPDNTIEKAMIDNDVTGSQTYSKSSEKEIDICAIAILKGLLSEPDVTEGGYSIRYDRAAVEKQIGYLSEKHGLTDTAAPTVTGRTVW